MNDVLAIGLQILKTAEDTGVVRKIADELLDLVHGRKSGAEVKATLDALILSNDANEDAALHEKFDNG